MNTTAPKLSVPAPRLRPPRPLSASEFETASRLADSLCSGKDHPVPRPSECVEYQSNLELALATREDVFDQIVGALGEAAQVADPEDWLRTIDSERPDLFRSLSAVLAGAYLMIPVIREHVGYPGQGRHPAPYDQIVDELEGGILDSVIQRGDIYRRT